jgi:hypothetical protein
MRFARWASGGLIRFVGSRAIELAAQRLFRLHSPDLYNASGVNFGAMKNLLFPRPVLLAEYVKKLGNISEDV